jgi:hypothetical protein
VNTWELEKVKPIEERIFLGEERKADLVKKKQDAEKKEREAKASVAKTEKVNLFDIPKVKFSNSFKYDTRPATEKQIEYMKKLGIWQEGCVYTIGQASELISGEPATSNQIWMLTKIGYDTSKGVTRGEAELAFRDAEERKLIEPRENSYKQKLNL